MLLAAGKKKEHLLLWNNAANHFTLFYQARKIDLILMLPVDLAAIVVIAVLVAMTVAMETTIVALVVIVEAIVMVNQIYAH